MVANVGAVMVEPCSKRIPSSSLFDTRFNMNPCRSGSGVRLYVDFPMDVLKYQFPTILYDSRFRIPDAFPEWVVFNFGLSIPEGGHGTVVKLNDDLIPDHELSISAISDNGGDEGDQPCAGGAFSLHGVFAEWEGYR